MTDRREGPTRRGNEQRGFDTVRVFRHRIAEAMLADAAIEDHPRLRSGVLGFVDERIASMPSHLRVGVQATEWMLLITSWGGALAHSGRAELSRRLRRWGSSRLPPVTQYVRLIRSLVLLAAHEFAEENDLADRW